MVLRLRETEGPKEGRVLSFENGASESSRLVLGRGSQCDIEVSDGSDECGVSRRHCELTISVLGELFVRDLNSMNGTHVNGERVGNEGQAPVTLCPGDRLRMGMVLFLCESDGIEESEALEEVLTAFRPIHEVGRGGAGIVYRGTWLDTGEPVALKVLHLQEPLSHETRRRLLREAHLSVQLSHPNIVKTFRCWQCPKAFVLAMEYCPAGTLTARCEEERPCVEQAVHWVLNLLDALDYAHNASVWTRKGDDSPVQASALVHRDVSPKNLLFARDGVLKLADFGLAKSAELAGASLLTKDHYYAGSPRFLPRQMATSGGLLYAKPEVDVWAAAAVLFWLLTGTTPRRFSRGEDVWRTLWTQPARSIRQFRLPISDRLAAVIDESLIDNPHMRIISAADLRDRLLDVMGGGIVRSCG